MLPLRARARRSSRLLLVSKVAKTLDLPVSGSTCWRWATVGIKGRKLESQRIGGRLYTSVRAVKKFLAVPPEIGHAR